MSGPAVGRRATLVRALQGVPGFDAPRPDREQVVTPAEAAADLLEEALARGDLRGRRVLDLGCGTGRLAIGAALLGARSVSAVDLDARAIDVGRAAAHRLGLAIDWAVSAVESGPLAPRSFDTVVMNPPFGAQRRGADRPFWDRALTEAGGAVYAFALRASRTFIARRAVAASARIESQRPVAWELPRTFPHHRRASAALAVDLWVIRIGDRS
ncbi:MAG: METTL5 family protein [Thermoplasmata archaeon]